MSTDYDNLVLRAEAAATSAAESARKTSEDRIAVESIVTGIDGSKIPSIKASKEAIRQAIVDKGQDCDVTVPFEQYATKIANIETKTNLDFITATAEDIRAGKVGADSNGGQVLGVLEVGSDVEYGYINESGLFQQLDLSGDVPTPVGEPTEVDLQMFKIAVDDDGNPIILPFITAGANQILKGFVGADKYGNPVNGSIRNAEFMRLENKVKVNSGGYVADDGAVIMEVGTYHEGGVVKSGVADIEIPGDTYLGGNLTIQGDQNLVPENIAEGKEILGVLGTFKGSGGSVSGGMEIYKCASVDTSAKTWTGYKAVLTDGVYSFEETLTTGLSYSAVEPEVGKVYSADALIEVKKLFDGTDPHLLLYFSMDDTGKAVDKVNGIELSASGNATGGVPGVIGNCWQASDGGYLSGSNTAFALPKVFTFNLLVNFSSSGDCATVFEFGSYNSNSGYGFYTKPGGTVSWRVGNSGWNSFSSSTLPADEWAMLTVTCDGSNRTLYINGVSENTRSVNTVVNATSIGAFSRAGTDGSGASMNGKIDEVQLWDYAMTADEVTALYNKLMGGDDDSGKQTAYIVSGSSTEKANGDYYDTGRIGWEENYPVYSNDKGCYLVYFADMWRICNAEQFDNDSGEIDMYETATPHEEYHSDPSKAWWPENVTVVSASGSGGYLVSGAGYEAVNGTYTATGNTVNGCPQYSNGTSYLHKSNFENNWGLFNDPDVDSMGQVMYYCIPNAPDDPASGEWINENAAYPPPTVTKA